MTLTDALQDVEIAFLQVEFALKLLTYCESKKMNPSEFDTDLTILLKNRNLGFPTGNFSELDDIIKAAKVSVALAFGSSALVLDRAWEVAGIDPNPESKDETIQLRTFVYMVRCAYAHGVAEPKWKAHGRYGRVIDIKLPSGTITLDLGKLDGQVFDFDTLGGHHRWFEIRVVAVERLSRRKGEVPENGEIDGL